MVAKPGNKSPNVGSSAPDPAVTPDPAAVAAGAALAKNVTPEAGEADEAGDEESEEKKAGPAAPQPKPGAEKPNEQGDGKGGTYDAYMKMQEGTEAFIDQHFGVVHDAMGNAAKAMIGLGPPKPSAMDPTASAEMDAGKLSGTRRPAPPPDSNEDARLLQGAQSRRPP